MLKSLLAWRLSGFASLSRFRKREDGAAAVEFAMVVLPFFGLIFAVLELAIFFFASSYLENGLFKVSRKVLTQQMTSASICSTFKTAVETELAGWFSVSKDNLTLSIKPVDSFSASDVAKGKDVDFKDTGKCTFGSSGQTMIIKATYDYPFQGFRFIASSATLGKDMTLSASTAFRVE
jgi:Flp pilus assembly protein TadG